MPQAFGTGKEMTVAGVLTRAWIPWSLQLNANVPAVVGNVVAQGDSNGIGCRIVVNGQVKAERISNEVNAHTHGLVSGA